MLTLKRNKKSASERKPLGRVKDLTGMKFGRWTVERFGGFIEGCANSHWVCKCKCGSVGLIRGSQLTCAGSTSCGCLSKEVNSKREARHGMYGTPEYKCWQAIDQRCNNPLCDSYPRYGGRGVKMCKGWKTCFEDFHFDVGNRPDPKLTLDRKDNDGHYSCGHCEECLQNGWTSNWRWVTMKKQANNRSSNVRFELDGELKTISELADLSGLPYHVVNKRLSRMKWTVQKAVTQPLRKWPSQLA